MTGAQIAARAARAAVVPAPNGKDRAFARFFRGLMYAAVGLTMLALFTLLYDIAKDGLHVISWDFLTRFPSRIIPESSGIQSAIYGTLYLMVIVAVIVVPLGVATAVYLEEYADPRRWWNRAVEVNIQNLAAVPSVVYGILGLAFIVRGPISLGRTLLAGGITLSLLVLPVVIIVAREAIRAVPSSIRDGSLALGATQWQTIRKNVLPYALPGILTASILGIARVAGETAPIMFTAAYALRDEMPWQVAHWTDFFFQGVMALPYHIYVVSSKIPQNEYTEHVQYGAAFVFLVLVMLIAATSIILRERSRNRLSW